MDDTTQTDSRPEITRREVSWHATCAAIRARKQAEALGMDPEARTALVHAAAAEGCGEGMPIVTLGTLWAMGELEPFLADLCEGNEHLDQVLVCHTLLNPESVLLAVLERRIESIREGMLATSLDVSAVRAAQLCVWFDEEMARVKSISGSRQSEPQKKN